MWIIYYWSVYLTFYSFFNSSNKCGEKNKTAHIQKNVKRIEVSSYKNILSCDRIASK